MATRAKILIVDSDMITLSRVYLALIHRNYKTEASTKVEELVERMKRMKPSIIILGEKEYRSLTQPLKLPTILLLDKAEGSPIALDDILVGIEKPVHIDTLIEKIEALVI